MMPAVQKKMYKFQENNPIQQAKEMMPFEFRQRAKKTQHVNPSKYGYVYATNSILKTVNLDLEDIKN
jgi:hypothetical protein